MQKTMHIFSLKTIKKLDYVNQIKLHKSFVDLCCFFNTNVKTLSLDYRSMNLWYTFMQECFLLYLNKNSYFMNRFKYIFKLWKFKQFLELNCELKL